MPEWLLPILVGVVIAGLAGLIWRAHEKRDEERFNDVWNQIGRNSESGMRKTVHKSANACDYLLKRDAEIERRLERVESREEER
jgi:hypothetical protein